MTDDTKPNEQQDGPSALSDGLELEISKLNEAVDSFAEAMKAKLAVKAAEGFRGWDRAGFESLICSKLLTKANLVEFDRKQAVDIANLAMMLWWQSSNRRAHPCIE